jgi:hypothetical protein
VVGRSSVEHTVECDGKNCRLPLSNTLCGQHRQRDVPLGAHVNPKIVSEMLGHASMAITLGGEQFPWCVLVGEGVPW